MGAYLYFRVPPEQSDDFNAAALSLPENKRLVELQRAIVVIDRDEIAWCERHRPDLVSYYSDRMGKGDWKASGISPNEGKKAGLSYGDIFEQVACVFEELHKKFDIKIYSGSCALSREYFSLEQLLLITKNGDALSSRPTKDCLEVLAEMGLLPKEPPS